MREVQVSIKRLLPGIILLTLFPAAWLLYPLAGFLPATGCCFRFITGRPCPFCGLTHACCAALHGDFAAAAGFHPFWWLALLVILYWAIALLFDGMTGADFTAKSKSILTRCRLPVFAGILLFAVYRYFWG